MIHGSAASPSPQPTSRQTLILLVVAAVALCSIGMIIVGVLDRPTEPSWADGRPTAPDGTPTASYPLPAQPVTPTQSRPASSSPTPARTVPSRKLSTKPSRSPSPRPSKTTRATTAPPPAATPSRTSTPPRQPATTPPTTATPVAQLLAACSPEGARARTRLGTALVCTTRPWDRSLRWRLA